MTKSAENCIVLMCDLNYLLYTLVCASQARENAPEGTDVLVFLDADATHADLVARVTAITGVQVALIPKVLSDEIAAIKPHSAHFSGSHLSRSALLRLKVPEIIGDGYRRILYLDGDVQVLRSLKPLFDMPLQPGNFFAVRDWKGHQTNQGMPEASEERRKLTALGLSEAQWGRYFNTGMLMGDMTAWREIGTMALDFYKAHPEVCETYDQCALNAVAKDRVTLVSPRWNYLRHLMTLPVYKKIQPAIIHFAAPPKPWNAPVPPWGQARYTPYVRMNKLLKDMKLPWHKLPLLWQLKWHLRSLLKPMFPDPVYRKRMQDLMLQDGTA